MRTVVIFLISAMVGLWQPIFAQYFGKNKVQYKNFTWYYIQSEHFDVYFYEGGFEIARFTAEIAEKAYQQLRRDFNYDIQKRIVFIVYKSHNDWQQTNVVMEYLTEGIGGVTELYKNRVVVPFEGSYEQFRHVIHHELVHAVMNDLLYGGSIQSLLRNEVTPPPLWFSEGLAEFESEGWNTRLDMVVRDAVLSGYLPPLQYLEYFLVYQGGASVFKFIAETYGREKIGEILNQLRGGTSFQKVLQATTGMNYEEFTEKWHRALRREYWPEVKDRKEPVEVARRLTNHKKKQNYLNVSPAITPHGDKVAYITDERGYQEIRLISAIDGKKIKTLVKGQQTESFEELHFLRPGMSFSPDGRKLAFTAKSGAWDAIYIIDIHTGKTEKHLMKLDGAFTTSWSPDGRYIAFVGNKDGQSDIYIFDLEADSLIQITDDIFTDDQPSWAPDSKSLLFVSDRKDYVNDSSLPPDFKMSDFDFEKRDIYQVQLPTGKITRLTNTPWEEQYPVFAPDGKKVLFISDENGIPNVYVLDLEKQTTHAITNLISGAVQIGLDADASKMVFTSFYEGGFDIYLMNNPLEQQPLDTLVPTQLVVEMRQKRLPEYAREWQPSAKKLAGQTEGQTQKLSTKPVKDYSRFVFTRENLERNKQQQPEEQVELPREVYQAESGEYKIRKYKIKFSPDIVTGTAGYNTFFGVQGYTTLAFSDLLGDHKIIANINLISDLRNSDLTFYYMNLKRRWNYGLGAYHLAYLFFRADVGLTRYRNFGANFLLSYPFSRFRRMDFSLVWYNVYLEYLQLPIPTEKVQTVLPGASYVYDDVLWGYTGPVAGARYSISTLFSPKVGANSRDFRTIKFDYRKYFMLNRDYQFAVRLAGGASFGPNAQQFFLGGIDNWFVPKYQGGRRVERIDDVFFSEFVTPLRGTYYYDRIGTRYLLANLEFRFPLIEYLALGFPKLRFFNIRGVMFYDIGSAWYGNSFKAVRQLPEEGTLVFDDISSGFGIGARVFFLFFLMRIDVAWNYNLQRISQPIWYFSFGADL